MNRIWIAVLALPLAAQIVPNRYIVELSGEPAATYAVKTKGNLRAALADRRAAIQSEQLPVRQAVQNTGGTVLASIDTVANALVVEIPDSQAASLNRLPGVLRVHKVWEGKLFLDHALPLSRIPEAWMEAGGEDRAGTGMKIGIIDTGLDADHPAFFDSNLQPAGVPAVGFENNPRIIVARSYDRGPVLSGQGARDLNGHGTGVAMVAAGGRTAAPLATISGVAPKAYLGIYRVFSGNSGSFSSDLLLRALDDAVADGMDVVNLSLGLTAPLRPSVDPFYNAVERAAAAGVIVVAAAGNEGPYPGSVGPPASAPSTIAVGATANSRIFSAFVQPDGSGPITAEPGSRSVGGAAVTGPMVDLAAINSSALLCGALPADALSGHIVLILRGECTFESKLNNAQNAGALGAVIYTYAEEPGLLRMETGSAALPALSISHEDGLRLKALIQERPELTATLQLSRTAVPADPNNLADFSSIGPNTDTGIKPDLVATGTNVYTAAEKTDPTGESYDASGFLVQSGTSFSAPLVSGAAAVLKGARPGLTAEQYRSLLINSTARFLFTGGQAASTQKVGTGLLDLSAAMRATVTASPVSISFGASGGTEPPRRNISFTNVGTAADVFSITVESAGAAPTAQVSENSFPLEPGATRTVSVEFTGSALEPGEYEGLLLVRGSGSGAEIRVPYWYAVPSNAPAYIRVLNSTSNGRAGDILQNAITFQVLDKSGIGMAAADPKVIAESGGGELSNLISADDEIPGAYSADVKLGAGSNVFLIMAGDVTERVVINGRGGVSRMP